MLPCLILWCNEREELNMNFDGMTDREIFDLVRKTRKNGKRLLNVEDQIKGYSILSQNMYGIPLTELVKKVKLETPKKPTNPRKPKVTLELLNELLDEATELLYKLRP